MPSLTRALLSSLVVVCAQPALAGDPVRQSFFDRTLPLPAFTYDSSGADLLAERHLALYRASKDASAPGDDERSVAPTSVRTSASAKLRADPSREN